MYRTVLYFLLNILMFLFSVTLATAGLPAADKKLSIQQAMRAAYGNVGRDNTSTKKYDGETILVAPLQFAYLSDENGDRVYLVTSGILEGKNTFHFAAPPLDCFVFEKTEGRWKLSVSSKDFVQIGQWGKPPVAVDFVKIGPSSWALAISDGTTTMGDSEHGIALYRLDANGIRPIFSALTLGSSSGMLCDNTFDKQGNEIPTRLVEFDGLGYCIFDETELFFLPSTGQLYDLKAVTTDRVGSEGPDGKPVPKVVKEEYFRFDAGQNKYIPVDKSQTLGPAAALMDANSNYRVAKANRLFESPTSNHGWIRFKARYPEDNESIAIVRGAFHGRD